MYNTGVQSCLPMTDILASVETTLPLNNIRFGNHIKVFSDSACHVSTCGRTGRLLITSPPMYYRTIVLRRIKSF